MYRSTQISLVAFASAALTILVAKVLGLFVYPWNDAIQILLYAELTVSTAAYAWRYLLQVYLGICVLLDALGAPLVWLVSWIQKRKK